MQLKSVETDSRLHNAGHLANGVCLTLSVTAPSSNGNVEKAAIRWCFIHLEGVTVVWNNPDSFIPIRFG
jgi:hypothetical protein